MNNKKGYTLVELLGIVAILAIIAIIVTPLINKVIKDTTNNANAKSLDGHIRNVEYAISHDNIENGTSTRKFDGVSKNEDDLGFTYPDEDKVRCENYMIDDGHVVSASKCMGIDWSNYVYYSENINSTIDYKKVKNNPLTLKIKNGEVVYFNPEKGERCHRDDAKSTTGTRVGCMKWYAFNDSEGNDKVNLILDHNTASVVAYNSTNSNSEMKEVGASLTSTTSSWNSEFTPRLISVDEVAEITSANKMLSWESSKPYSETPIIGSTSSWYYFDGKLSTDDNWHSQLSDEEKSSNYAWIYNNTNGCKTFGCTSEDNQTYGYWTSTKVAGKANTVWVIHRAGRLYSSDANNSTLFGVRPVITVSKSFLQ